MKIYRILIFILFAFSMSSNTAQAQELKNHQWKNRVVLIISSETDSDLLNSQMQEFDFTSQDFRDRKLIGYQILERKSRLLDSSKNDWKESSNLFQKFADKKTDFKVILIGLDGNVKLEQNKVLTREKLFATIDAMPMRRAEMRNE
ncbi:protein of unknown function [Flavobacteriaceae bacterium MAR_2010_188]|nr:protein of unknown function [Flavobacteriaceae bacterium MAR_2010_188]